MRRPLWVFWLVAGLAVRFALAAATSGNPFDLESFRLVADVVRGPDPLSLYRVAEAGPFHHWPYPPGAVPVVLLADWAARLTAVAADTMIRLVLSVADVLAAVAVASHLRSTHPERWRLGAAVVLFGPSFVLLSGHHGQLDTLAFAPALLGVVAWSTGRIGGWTVPAQSRWWVTGLLIGVGAAVKTVPGVLLLAVLATARDRAEGVRTAVVATAVPAVTLLPFALADASAVVDALSYRGLPGLGGFSLLLHPQLATQWLAGAPVDLAVVTRAEELVTLGLLLATLAAAAVVARRTRMPAHDAAWLVVLTVLAFGGNWSMGYAIWLTLALVLAGRVREAATVQLAVAFPTVLVESVVAAGGWPERLVQWTYVPVMVALTVAAVVSWAVCITGALPGGASVAPVLRRRPR